MGSQHVNRGRSSRRRGRSTSASIGQHVPETRDDNAEHVALDDLVGA